LTTVHSCLARASSHQLPSVDTKSTQWRESGCQQVSAVTLHGAKCRSATRAAHAAPFTLGGKQRSTSAHEACPAVATTGRRTAFEGKHHSTCIRCLLHGVVGKAAEAAAGLHHHVSSPQISRVATPRLSTAGGVTFQAIPAKKTKNGALWMVKMCRRMKAETNNRAPHSAHGYSREQLKLLLVPALSSTQPTLQATTPCQPHSTRRCRPQNAGCVAGRYSRGEKRGARVAWPVSDADARKYHITTSPHSRTAPPGASWDGFSIGRRINGDTQCCPERCSGCQQVQGAGWRVEAAACAAQQRHRTMLSSRRPHRRASTSHCTSALPGLRHVLCWAAAALRSAGCPQPNLAVLQHAWVPSHAGLMPACCHHSAGLLLNRDRCTASRSPTPLANRQH
jgi:hypothetical protein